MDIEEDRSSLIMLYVKIWYFPNLLIALIDLFSLFIYARIGKRMHTFFR